MKISQKIVLAGIAFLLGSFVGCKSRELEERDLTLPSVKIINSHQYRFEKNKVTELTSDADDEAKYGVFSDIHGKVRKAKTLAQRMKEQGIEGIIVAGDLPNNEHLRYGQKDSRDDEKEIEEVLSVLAATELPILVIPGNHERKSDYQAALKQATIKYPNVIDMTQYRVFDGDDVDFVSLPGYQTFKIPGRQFIPDNGFWAQPKDVKELKALREGLDDTVVLITHGAGKTGSPGPATLYNGQDVGDALTTTMQQEANIPFAVVGHVHEAGGLAATFTGEVVKPGEWSTHFTANFGTLEDWKYLDGKAHQGMAGIITVKGNQAKYDLLVME